MKTIVPTTEEASEATFKPTICISSNTIYSTIFIPLYLTVILPTLGPLGPWHQKPDPDRSPGHFAPVDRFGCVPYSCPSSGPCCGCGLFLIDNGDAAVGEGPGVFPRSFWKKNDHRKSTGKLAPPSISTYYNPIHGMYDPIYNQI